MKNLGRIENSYVWIALGSLVLLIGCQQDAREIEPGKVDVETRKADKNLESKLIPQPKEKSPLEPPKAADAQNSAGPLTDTDKQPTIDEMLLFFPTKHPDGNWQPKNLEFEDVWITSEDGTQIHGWYCPCKEPRAYVLYAHGNAGNLTHRTDVVVRLQKQLQASVLIFDYRGYGRSKGVPTTKGAIADTHAAATALAKKAGVEESDLIFLGRSLGGALAIQVASDVQPRGLVVESTFASLKSIARHHYPKLAWLVPRKRLDSLTAIKSYQGNFMQSHGTDDVTVPFNSGKKLFEAANEPKRFVPIESAGHNDFMPQSYYESLEEFIDEISKENTE